MTHGKPMGLQRRFPGEINSREGDGGIYEPLSGSDTFPGSDSLLLAAKKFPNRSNERCIVEERIGHGAGNENDGGQPKTPR
ncbi:MAG TPA: hypothetical protein VL992_20870 [Tepidisphaeraceae bacterium]|nr:hypothetical protein [Tepidisphaeraceae bacterium]